MRQCDIAITKPGYTYRCPNKKITVWVYRVYGKEMYLAICDEHKKELGLI